MRRYLSKTLLAAMLLNGAPSGAWAEQLSQVELFHRCFAQLTQGVPAPGDARLQAVTSGAKTALQACTEILDAARFTASGGTAISDPNDSLAKAVVKTFYSLHASWPRHKQLYSPQPDDDTLRLGAETFYSEEGAYPSFVTRALLAPAGDVDSVTQGTEHLIQLRTTMSPPHSYRGVPNATAGNESDFRMGVNHQFAPQGELLGIAPSSIAPVFYSPATAINVNSMPDFPNLVAPPAATVGVSTINYADTATLAVPISPQTTQFAVNITGQLQVATSGAYTLFLNVANGGEVWLDGARVLSRNSAGEGSAAITLTQGAHDLRVACRVTSGTQAFRFSWQGPSITKQVVPASALLSLSAAYHTQSQPAPHAYALNRGGGFMGDGNYLLTSFIQNDPNYVPDGALKVNRSWPRAVLHDALCKDIPALRDSDVASYLLPQSTLPFRQSVACLACHATTDPLAAGTIKGLRYNIVSTQFQTSPLPMLVGTLGVTFRNPSLLATNGWPDTANTSYSREALSGWLAFRNYRGEYINQPVRSIEELGALVRQQDDYYACFAKRYYEYFLGISVDLNDSGAPGYVPLNSAEQFHRDQVIALGSQLRSHKSLRTLILAILGSPQYERRDFGVAYGGS